MICRNGELACADPSGADQCIDATTDEAHCGSCANSCAAHEVCSLGVCTTCSPTHFLLPVAYPTGLLRAGNSEPLVVDLDQDGQLDVVLPDAAGSSVSIFYGTGGGSLSERRSLETVSNPVAALVADVDQDGRQDIVVLGAGFLNVHWGAPRNPFTNFRRFAIDEDWNLASAVALALADVNGDSAPDAIVVTRSSGSLYAFRVHLIAGGSDFPASESIIYEDANALHAPQHVQAVDLDGDGLTDIALLAGTVHALLNNGDGSFRFQENWSGSPARVLPQRLLDLNGDGRLDLASAEPYGQGTLLFGYYLRIALGNAAGGMDLLPRPANTLTSAFAPNFVFGDVNGDGFVDVVSREDDVNLAVTALGNGSGTFAEPAPLASDVAAGQAGMALADLTADGRPELILAHETSSSLTVHAGRGDGTFDGYMLPLPDATYLRSAVVLAGATEPTAIVVGGLDDGRFRVLSIHGTQDLALTQDIGIYRPLSVSLGDIDGDGLTDAVVPAERALYWLRNTGSEHFADPAVVANGFFGVAVQAGDFDGDKQAELFFNPNSGKLTVFKRNQADQSWSQFDYPIGYSAVTAVGDINGDGLDDVLVANNDYRVLPYDLQVWLGSPSGLMIPEASMSLPDRANLVRVADLDGDGINDVFVGHASGYVVFKGGTQGAVLDTLEAADAPIASANAIFLDVDQDGVLDLVTRPNTGTFELWRGLGGARFERSETYLVPGANAALGLADFDGDGLRDLLLSGGSQYSGSLLLLRGAVRCE